MRLERWLVLGGLCLFVLSLLLPAILSDSFPAQSGLELLRQRAEFSRNGIYAWYANPLLAVALVLCWLGLFRSGLATAVVAALLALSIFLAPGALERAGTVVPEFRYGLGFYMWLGAVACALAAASAGLAANRGGPPRD
jgi:hypothetical protein